MFGIKGHDFSQAITMKSNMNKVLTQEVRMLVALLGYPVYDFEGFGLIFTKDKVLPLFDDRHWKKINLLIDLCLS